MKADATTDAKLVARCRAGDDAAWGELVDRFGRYVHAIAVVGFRLPTDDAEDVFQEVFARTYERLDRLRDDAAIRPWIGQLTRRLCVDRLRAGRREAPADTAGETAAQDSRLEQIEEALTVRAALATLPDHCRDILDRFIVRDQSYKTISAQAEIPLGTVASRVARCLAKLRAALEGRNERAGASSS